MDCGTAHAKRARLSPYGETGRRRRRLDAAESSEQEMGECFN